MADDENADGEARKTTLPLRDSKGWDGKLRVTKADEASDEDAGDAGSENGGADGAAEDSEAEEAHDPPRQQEMTVIEGQKINADDDLMDDYEEDETEVDLNHRRVSSIPALRLERFGHVENLCLRRNEITSIEFPTSWASAATLKDLDLYDNNISSIRGLEGLTELTSLDLSFNNIRHIKRVEQLTKLKEIFFVQNRIGKIENLEALTELTNLELGANRIREIEKLETLTKLEELYLGKNKISEIKNLSHLQNLRILSIQSNRLTSPSLAHLAALPALEELYVPHNLLDSLEPLSGSVSLRTIDISWNPVASLRGLEPLAELVELWASRCRLDSFEEVGRVLGDKEALETVYFEGNPMELRQKVLYRNKVKLALPQVRQIDATFVRLD